MTYHVTSITATGATTTHSADNLGVPSSEPDGSVLQTVDAGNGVTRIVVIKPADTAPVVNQPDNSVECRRCQTSRRRASGSVSTRLRSSMIRTRRSAVV